MGTWTTSWDDLTPPQRKAVIVIGAVTSLLQVLMLWDLWRRPADEIRGSKRAWVVASFVRPFGQIAYVIWGRRPPAEAAEAADPADA